MNMSIENPGDPTLANEGHRLELEKCRQRLEHMEGLFAHVADVIFVADPDGRIVDVNPAACRLLGYSRPELLAMHPWDFVTSASQDEILGLLRNMKQNEPVSIQRTYCRKSGETLAIDLQMTRCDLAGRDLIIVAGRDVTGQKRLQDRLRRSEKNLAEGQRLTKTGSWILDYQTGNTDWSVETCRIFGFPDPPPSPHYSEFRARVRPEDRGEVDRGLKESFETGEPRPLHYVFVLPDGTRKNIETISQPVKDESGRVLSLMGTVMDVTERKRAQDLLSGEKQLLEMIARGDALPLILESLCRLAEKVAGQVLVSILLMSSDGKRLQHGAAPSLPKDYVQAIDGSLIGPKAGACGTAAYRKESVYVPDISTDPLWEDYRDIAMANGLRACWSTPIFSTQNHVLGTFALYPHEEGSPTLYQKSLVEQFAHLASIAIERTLAQQALQASELLARGQLNALTRTLDALSAESEADKFLAHVLCNITAQLGGHSSSVWLWNAASGLMNFECAYEDGRLIGKSEPGIAAVSPSLRVEDVWPWPEIFRTGKPWVLDNIREGQDFPWRERLLAKGVVTILAVPMKIAGRVEGVIGIRFTSGRTFGVGELELAQAFANQAMLAMKLTSLSLQSRQAAVVAERNRMARDIHDTLAQGLTGIIVQLEAAEDARLKDLPEAADEHVTRARELARESLQEARRSVHALRPRVLSEKSLCQALQELIGKMTTGTGLHGELRTSGVAGVLGEDAEDNVLRICQEFLTNSLRHSGASRFRANLDFSGKAVVLEMGDNGKGFDKNRINEGFGLIGIQERADAMGAKLTIESSAGNGTSLTLRILLEE